MSDELKRLFDKYVVKIHEYKKVNKIKELVPISELNGVRSLCRLFDLFATTKNGVSTVMPPVYRCARKIVKGTTDIILPLIVPLVMHLTIMLRMNSYINRS